VHSQVRTQIENSNKKCKEQVDMHRKKVVFKKGDLIWIHLRKARFPTGIYGKLQPRADGPFRVLERINDNAYKVDLLGEYNVSGTFNVVDLSPYIIDSDNDNDTSEVEEVDSEVADSRMNLFLGGENDAICTCFTKMDVTFDPTVDRTEILTGIPQPKIGFETINSFRPFFGLRFVIRVFLHELLDLFL
jgi:hypothetical protein